jgi:beta-phosphoglucomutase-like phosphatase (HAD superfamily)
LANNQTYNIPPDVQQNLQKAIDFPGVFDGSKYKDVNEAAKAAAAVDENKFIYKGSIYVVKAPESVTNQIKNSSTFNEAFALAQKNLGEGNVFEWRGKLYVNRTTEQDAAMPYNGNKFDDRGAAAYAAHMAGKTTFTWGGNTWQLPSNYASQISSALGQNPNQSAAETKRLLDANIRAASSSAAPAEKFRLDQTGIPLVDKVIGAIAYSQGRGIEDFGVVLRDLSSTQALLAGGSFENTLKNVGNLLEEFGKRLQPEDLAKEAKRQADALNKEIERAAKETNPFTQTAIVAKALWDNKFGYWSDVAGEIGGETGSFLIAGTALVFAPLTGTVAGGATLLAATSAVLNGAEVFGSSGKQEYDRLIAKGETEKDARTGGIIMGATNAAITIPLEYVGDKALLLPYLNGIRDSAQAAVKTVVNPVTVNAATEYLEELFQGMASRAVRGETQNVAEDSARAIYAAAVGAGTSAGILTPAAINNMAQVGLDKSGKAVTFQEFLNGTKTVNPDTLNMNASIARLSDGSNLTLAGLQLMLPNTGISRSFIYDIAPELAVSRNDIVAYSSKNEPIQFRYSQPFFQKHLIQTGPIPNISQADAINLLQSQGRSQPTQAEIDRVVDQARDEKDTDIAKQIADPFTVSLEEVKEAARAAGYAISDDEAKKYVGERLESEAIPLLQQQFDPLATTEEEVRQIFAERGYTPTQAEIERFVGSTPEAQIQSQVKTYVDPRMLYPEDIKNLAAQEGYQISDARARELSGQKDKQSNLNALRAEFDAGAVTLDEARAMFAQTPYKPTDAEIQQFVGSKSESQIRQEIANYADPRYVTDQEIKDAAAQEGYQITDEQALALAGQKMQAETIAKFRSDIDAKAVTEAEAKAFFNEFGYKPTPQELQQFTASRSEEQIRADISAYVDPRYVTLDEVKKVAAEEGYAITDDEALSLTGQKSQQEVLDQLRVKADAAAVLQSEAQEFFREFGYTPTPEELQQFTLSKPESQIREDIRAYVDPRFVTLEEVKAAAKEEGYDLTDQEAAAIVGQRNQEEAIAQFRSTINPKAVTESEAREFFKQLGYEPTPEELRMFTASRSEEQVQADLAAYVNPRYVTMEEVKAVAASEGYDISDEEALALTGQKSEKEVLDALRLKADTSAVLRSEAEEYFRKLGYTPTEEEVNQFVASRPEADIRAELGAYVDPRFVTLEEVKEAARAEGYDLTDEEAAALVGQKSQEEAIAQFREQIDPKAVIDAEAQAFFAEFGYVPNNDELSLFIQSRSEEQVRDDIQTYIDPRQVTREEVEAKFRELQSEYGFTPEEIEQFIRSGQDITQESVLGEIGGYIDPRYVTPEEVKAGYAELGLTTPLEGDVSKFTGQTAQEGLQERLQEYLPTAQFNYTAKQLADLQAENARKQEIKRLNDQFVLDITALIDQNIDIKTAIDQTLGKIDDPTQKQLIDIGSPSIQMLAQQQATKKAAQQQQKQQLVQQGMEMMGGQTPGDTQVMSEPFKPDVQSLYSGDPGDEFISPLKPFLEKVEEGSYTGEPQPQTAEQPLAESKDLTDMKRREQGYFTYGQPSEIEQNIAAGSDPFGYYTAMAMSGGMKEGGMVVPLMAEGGGTRYGRYAGGGLNLVPHTGKMRVDFREGDAVTGSGDGQSDDIPAMLADGEFVIPADVVAALGNGSTKAGSDKLYDMMHSIRSHVRSADPKKLPPPVKSPLDYISKRPKAKRR